MIFRHFLENVGQKIAFFGARSPLKISHNGAIVALRKNLKLFTKKWMSLSYTKAGTLKKNLATRIKGRTPPSARYWIQFSQIGLVLSKKVND